MRQFRFLPVAVLLVYLTACGGGSQNGNPIATAISGNWQISLQKASSKAAPKPVSGFLLENGSGAVTGNLMVTNVPCSGVGVTTGSVDQPNVTLTVSPAGTTLNLSGTLGSDSSSMSGSFTLLATGCSGSQSNPSETGTWTANLVQPLSGSLQGTFTSTMSATSGTAFPITGQISQGPNTGSSYAVLTGNLAITGSSCFSSATLSGVISGTTVAINIATSNGTEIGQITGTSSLAATSLTGTYKIVPQGTLPGTPCQQGDQGTVSLTL